MRVGILTFHAALNPGAFLQALATTQTIRKLGHVPVVIDYMPRRLRPHPYRSFLSTSILRGGWSKCVDRLRLYRAFESAKAQLPLTPRIGRREALSRERFDAIVIGSDVVWNFRSKHFGRDGVYFGQGLNCGRLVAYAPSCGTCTLDDAIPPYVVEGLRRFHAVSVRDEMTRAIVGKAGGPDVPILPDPAFGLDVVGLGEKPDIKDYLLVYSYNPFQDSEIEQIRAFAADRGLRTVGVCYRQDWCDENRLTVSPFQWLGLIEAAAYVATGMFHGTVFSLKYARKIAISMNRPVRSKIEPLLNGLGLTGCVMSAERPVKDIFDDTIDYESVRNESLPRLAGVGARWLEHALNG